MHANHIRRPRLDTRCLAILRRAIRITRDCAPAGLDHLEVFAAPIMRLAGLRAASLGLGPTIVLPKSTRIELAGRCGLVSDGIDEAITFFDALGVDVGEFRQIYARVLGDAANLPRLAAASIESVLGEGLRFGACEAPGGEVSLRTEHVAAPDPDYVGYALQMALRAEGARHVVETAMAVSPLGARSVTNAHGYVHISAQVPQAEFASSALLASAIRSHSFYTRRLQSVVDDLGRGKYALDERSIFDASGCRTDLFSVVHVVCKSPLLDRGAAHETQKILSELMVHGLREPGFEEAVESDLARCVAISVRHGVNPQQAEVALLAEQDHESLAASTLSPGYC